MTVLADAVKARFTTTRLAQLTNKDSQAATIDDPTLELAVTAITAKFITYTATTFDETDDAMIDAGATGVYAQLQLWTDHPSDKARSQYDSWKQDMRDLARTLGRDRIKPVATAQPVPVFQREEFVDLIPLPPRRRGLEGGDAEDP